MQVLQGLSGPEGGPPGWPEGRPEGGPPGGPEDKPTSKAAGEQADGPAYRHISMKKPPLPGNGGSGSGMSPEIFNRSGSARQLALGKLHPIAGANRQHLVIEVIARVMQHAVCRCRARPKPDIASGLFLQHV